MPPWHHRVVRRSLTMGDVVASQHFRDNLIAFAKGPTPHSTKSACKPWSLSGLCEFSAPAVTRIRTLCVTVHLCPPRCVAWVCQSVCPLPVVLATHIQMCWTISGALNMERPCKASGVPHHDTPTMYFCLPFPIPCHGVLPPVCDDLGVACGSFRIPAARRACMCNHGCAPTACWQRPIGAFRCPQSGYLLSPPAFHGRSRTPSQICRPGFDGVLSGGHPATSRGTLRTGNLVPIFLLVGRLRSWPSRTFSPFFHPGRGWTRESTGGGGLPLVCDVMKCCLVPSPAPCPHLYRLAYSRSTIGVLD